MDFFGLLGYVVLGIAAIPIAFCVIVVALFLIVGFWPAIVGIGLVHIFGLDPSWLILAGIINFIWIGINNV